MLPYITLVFTIIAKVNKKVLYATAFLVKGWEVSLLLLLPFLHEQGKITLFEIGVLAGTLSLLQVTSNFFAGHLAEKIGSKNVIITSLALYLFVWTIIFAQQTFFFLAFACALAGTAAGIFVPIANSTIAKLADKNRGREMGNFSAFTDLGRVALSAITAFLVGTYGYMTPALLYMMSAFFLFLLFLKFKFALQTSFDHDTLRQKVGILFHLKKEQYLLSVITGMGDAFASASLYIFIPLLLSMKGIPIASGGLLTSLFFIGYMSGRLFLGRLADKHGFWKILSLSEIAMASLIVLLVGASNPALVAILLFLLGIFTRGTSPIIRAMVAESVDKKEHFDKAYSFYSFSVNSSSAITRPIFGIISSHFGIASIFYLSSIAALLTIVPILKYARIKKK